MLAKVTSCAVIALDGALVEVELDINHKSLPSLTIVGLPDAAVKESAERVRAALKNSGFDYPRGRITVNLAPADLRKEGPAYDLPIAIALLMASGQVPPEMDDCLAIGELSLDGTVRHTNGVLPMAMVAQREGFRTLLVPQEDAPEAALVDGVEAIPVDSLHAAVSHLLGTAPIPPYERDRSLEMDHDANYPFDMSDIKGQEHAKRALEVAAAGSHNALLKGPPGSGKTLLAGALPSILPSLSFSEALDITRIYSVSGMLPADTPLIRQRPFRSPHHTISHAGLVGGGRWPRPGEISLAHRGVLFLDELPEFGQRDLEVLRQPIESRVITISRAQGSLTFPANFMLVGAMNPCPCGFYGDPIRPCSCSNVMVTRYQNRISGPLLDRIDIHLEVPRVEFDKLTDDRRGERSEVVRDRVAKSRERQSRRFEGTSLICNADMGPREVEEFCRVDETSRMLLKAAVQRLHLSARGYHRVLKLARTIADLAGSDEIEQVHVAEALQYRPRW